MIQLLPDNQVQVYPVYVSRWVNAQRRAEMCWLLQKHVDARVFHAIMLS